MASDAAESAGEHPLQNVWTLWCVVPSGGGAKAGRQMSADAWKEKIKPVAEIATVEDFWRVYNNIQRPSGLPPKTYYYFFKKGIEPAVEDPANQGGGELKVTFNRPKSFQTVDDTWRGLLLALIGETLDEGDEFTGAGLSKKDAELSGKITLWTRSVLPEPEVRRLKAFFRETLKCPEAASYSKHDIKTRGGRS